MTGHRVPRAGPRSTRRTPSSCCSRRTPTPTSRSRRSTTSGSTTTCSSRGTRRRSGSTRSSTTCSATGSRRTRDDTGDVRVVGHRWSERSHEVKTFLARNHVPYRWLDVERDDEARTAARRSPHAERRRPAARARPRRRDAAVAVDPRARRRARPADARRAAALRPVHRRRRSGRPGRRGVRRVRGAADRRRRARGARAARPVRARRSRTTSASRRACPAPTSPTGRSPRRARFGAEMVLARDVVGFEARGPVRAVRFDDGAEIEARARARRHRGLLPAARGAGARRARPAAASTTARPPARRCQCEGDDVYVVGAANSAGQAALNLARYARRVVAARPRRRARGRRCRSTSSSGSAPRDNIEVRLRTEVVGGARRRPPRGASPLADRATGHRGGGADELAVRLHRRLAAHRLARRRRRPRRARASCSPATTCSRRDGAARGRWPGRRSRSRPACPACSRPATSASTR